MMIVPGAWAAAKSDWVLADCPTRAIVTVPEPCPPLVLVQLPWSGAAGESLVCKAFDPQGAVVPCRTVHISGSKAHVVLDVGDAPRRGPYSVYFRNGPPVAETVEPGAPVWVEVFGMRGTSAPDTWERMQYLFGTAGYFPNETWSMTNFSNMILTNTVRRTASARATAGGPRGKDGAPSPRRPLPAAGRYLVHLVSYGMFPEDGPYRFAVDSADGSFLLVDGEVVAEQIEEFVGSTWYVGQPVRLQKGLHRIEVFTCSDRNVSLAVGWQTPSQVRNAGGNSSDIGPIEVLPASVPVAGGLMDDVRLESIQSPLSPGFSFLFGQAYSFRGYPEKFVPVTFRSTSVSRLTTISQTRWSFDGQEQSGTNVPVTTWTFTGRSVHTARVEVRDEMGFRASCEREVDCRRVIPRERAASFDLVPVASACFTSDRIEPVVRVRGGPGPATNVVVWWRWQRADGAPETGRRTVLLSEAAVEVPLPGDEAGCFGDLRWGVDHNGVTLKSERLRTVVLPFSELPDRVDGDHLIGAQGDRVVFVTDERRNLRRTFTRPVRWQQVVCIDDTLCVGDAVDSGIVPYHQSLARLMAPDRSTAVRWVSLRPWSEVPESHGRLLKLVEVPAAVQGNPDVVVLSVGLRDIIARTPPDVFERQAAAISDMLVQVRKCRVVWLTPPPYAAEYERMRVYAAAILRVADARGLPVVDLFTIFQGGQDSSGSLLTADRTLALSQRGHNLVAQSIARVLRGSAP